MKKVWNAGRAGRIYAIIFSAMPACNREHPMVSEMSERPNRESGRNVERENELGIGKRLSMRFGGRGKREYRHGKRTEKRREKLRPPRDLQDLRGNS